MKKTDKRILVFLSILVVLSVLYLVTPTFAEFMDDFTTDGDVVGLNLNFDLSMSNIEEYEEITVDSNSYDIYNIDITNSLEDTIYYGVWYKMVNPKEKTDDIVIARLEDNRVNLSDSLDGKESKTVSIIIKNNTTDSIIIDIGIASSKTSVQDIEYLGGKHLITGEESEIDYYYDSMNKKYISTLDSNTFFTVNSVIYNDPSKIETYNSTHKGVYRVEAWGASNGDVKGFYTSTTIKLTDKDILYGYVGEVNKSTTDVRVVNGERDNALSINGTIMRIGTSKDDIYISGYFGTVSSSLDDAMKEKCKTGEEDIACSYHSSLKIFKNIIVLDNTNEILLPNGTDRSVGNLGNGAIKITPVVPNIEISTNKITVGTDYDISNIKCIDNGSGCNLVKLVPESTKELLVGSHKLNVVVIDDDGMTYRYPIDIEIVE